jgi:hypothetical protein
MQSGSVRLIRMLVEVEVRHYNQSILLIFVITEIFNIICIVQLKSKLLNLVLYYYAN